jgi:hypothetical protein
MIFRLPAPRFRSLRFRVWLLLGAGVTACHHAPRAPVVTDSTPASVADSTKPAPPPVPFTRIPRNASRFEIESVDDSTARFKPREAEWVQQGMTAYVVDPMNRDVMVARLRIVSVWNEMAVGVVTSQTTRVTTQHVVLLTEPSIPWWRSQRFWFGTVLGVFLGAAAAGVIAAQ